MSSEQPRPFSTLAACLCIALAYYVSGRLGLLLAIPPGYATAVWPASGIALAGLLVAGYRAWPGVWLGSFCLNVVNGFDASSDAALFNSLLLPGTIAVGAVLQAVVGAAFVKRFTSTLSVLEQELDVVWTLLLGGPLSCLLSASVGVGILSLRGLVPPESVLFNWWTWWVGDSIGVLIFAPLTLIWLRRPYTDLLRRKLLVTLPMTLMFAVVTGLFFTVSSHEQTRIDTQFKDWSDAFARQLHGDMDQNLDALYSIQSFYASSESVSREEFETFSGRLLPRAPGLEGLSWDRLVRGSDRAAYEKESGREIRERNAQAALVPAASRSEYVPLEYAVPPAPNDPALGFDVLSEPARTAAVTRARDTGEPSATAKLTLVQARSRDEAGMLIFLPVYRNRQPHETLAQRRQNIQGYAATIVRLQDFVRHSIAQQSEFSSLQLRVYDRTVAMTDPLLFSSEHFNDEERGGLSGVRELEVAGRKWELQLRLPAQYLVSHRSWQAWTLLAGGMLFTGLLGMFLLVVIGRGARVERLVDQRTAELSLVNKQLSREARRSDELELQGRRHSEALEASNRELEQFAYAVSHDLQAPLRGIASFSHLLEERCAAQLDKDGKEFLDFIRESADEMGRMIRDILQLSRINMQSAKMEAVASGDALDKACTLLRADIESSGTIIEKGFLPNVQGDMRLLTQLFQNLISNGIKFRREGVAPHISFGAQTDSGVWRFEVRDNGIGIAPENLPKLFQVFRRLNATDKYPGNGIGLALCKKIVALHEGKIWLESKPGTGTTFFFTLNRARNNPSA